MKIALVAPDILSESSRPINGNDVTAIRWRNLLVQLGHEVTLTDAYDDEPVDALVALHARKSADSVARFASLHPGRALVVVLTGTDLYVDFPASETVWESLNAATHLLALQHGALDVLGAELGAKTTVIHQSASPFVPPLEKAADRFQACLVANLRPIKDPLLAAEAARRLPAVSRVEVVHAGAPTDADLAAAAKEASRSNPRYRWVGPLSHEEARLLIGRSHVLLLTSRHEGGANVLSEALAMGIPIVASRAPGVEGFLGPSYPGLFPPGDADALAELIERAEHDEVFYRRLEIAGAKLARMVSPAREMRAWQELLSTFT